MPIVKTYRMAVPFLKEYLSISQPHCLSPYISFLIPAIDPAACPAATQELLAAALSVTDCWEV